MRFWRLWMPDGVVLVGNSLGAAAALAANSPRITARALVSPAGFIRLRVDPKLALASAVWLLRPTAEHTRRLLRLFVAPGADPPETEVEWMALMATCCRTTLAPPVLSAELLARRAERPCVVGVGEHDRFLPPHRLAPAVRRTMNLDARVFSDMGHLTTPADLDEVVSLVAEVSIGPATEPMPSDARSTIRFGDARSRTTLIHNSCQYLGGPPPPGRRTSLRGCTHQVSDLESV